MNRLITRLVAYAALGAAVSSPLHAQQSYGTTDFEATGSAAAHEIFLRGLLQLHNFEYEDARDSFLAAQAEDRDFVMAYWGEALTYEHPLWGQYDTEASRAALAKLGATPEARVVKAQTEREQAYVDSVNVLFGEGSQQERELQYSAALRKIYERYPDDVDAAALYALSILTTSHGGRDFTLYMRAGAITEDILRKHPRHPGALHYNIHSFDDPIHAPLGLNAANVYADVAPSAVHALHMGSHIYFALGMWELGSQRNLRAFNEAVARQPSPDSQYGGQAYHSLTWLIYSLTQAGKHAEAAEKLGLIEAQLARYGGPVNARNFISARAGFVVDTQDWDGRFAKIEVDYTGLDPVTIATDQYVRGVRALKHSETPAAEAALRHIGGEEPVSSGNRRDRVPRLLHLALAAQLSLEAGRTQAAIATLREAAELEASVPPDYGPAVPVQPIAELLGDVYRSLGQTELARAAYERSLAAYVGRERSIKGLAAVNGATWPR
jgi:tetratricopeptide (TPR) repeat protein